MVSRVVALIVVLVGSAGAVSTFDQAKNELVEYENALCQTEQDCVSKELRESAVLCWAVGPSGVDAKKLVRCPAGTACVVDKMVSNPFSDFSVAHIVRAGCAAALKEDDLKCGAVACPTKEYLFVTECCTTEGCNDPVKMNKLSLTKDDCTVSAGLKHGCYSSQGYHPCETSGMCVDDSLMNGPCPVENKRTELIKNRAPAPALTLAADSVRVEDAAKPVAYAPEEPEYVQIVDLALDPNNPVFNGQVGKVVQVGARPGQIDVDVNGLIFSVRQENTRPVTAEDYAMALQGYTLSKTSREAGEVSGALGTDEAAEKPQNIKVVGLTANANFNGKFGVRMPGEADTDGNVRVKIEGKVFKLRPENMELMP